MNTKSQTAAESQATPAQAPAVAAVSEAKRAVQPVDARRLKEWVQVVDPWFLEVPAGTTLEDVLLPSYWAHIARKLRAKALILVYAEDGTWEAELRVRDVGAQTAQVGVIRQNRWDTAIAAQEFGDFIIEHTVADGWRIRRKSDGSVPVKGFTTKDGVLAEIPGLLKRAA